MKNPRQYFTALALAVLALGWQVAQGATTILPSGETCFGALTPTSGGPGGTGTGFVGLLGPITPGVGGTNATYGGVALTGGSGSGATANITVSGGVVTQVAILNPGVQYVVGDTLSAIVGNVSGFSAPVASVAINSSLAGGKVYFYIPNTLTYKQTWQDAAQTILNQNPVGLDANGCAIIYGVGMYRQVLQDSLSNTIWDQLTTDTSAYNSTFWAGVAGGTPNAITITDIGFNGTDGSVLNFTALATNTGPATVNPSGYGAISVLQDTTGGPVALAPGQIIASNVISVVYRSSDNSFHLLNPPIQSVSGAIAPLCGASGLEIINGASPNSIIAVTAGSSVTVSSAGLVINRSNISLSAINITTGTSSSTANGMDGESVGINSWVYVWIIDNGSAPAGLVSLASGNGLAPVLPSGYIYKCRVGAMRIDGSGNLERTLQYGNTAQYYSTPVASMISGISGSISTPTWTGVAVAAFVPPTATEIRLVLSGGMANSTATAVMAAPNNGYGAYNSGTNPPPLNIANSSTGGGLSSIRGDFIIESANIYYASNSSVSSLLQCLGWKDSVNAN